MVHRMPIIRTAGEIARNDVAAGKDYDPPKPDWFEKHFASNETLNKIAEARAEYPWIARSAIQAVLVTAAPFAAG